MDRPIKQKCTTEILGDSRFGNTKSYLGEVAQCLARIKGKECKDTTAERSTIKALSFDLLRMVAERYP